MYEQGDQIRLPGETGYVKVEMVAVRSDGGVGLTVRGTDGLRIVELPSNSASAVEKISADGSASPADVLAGLWTRWMLQAAASVNGTALATSPLRDLLHQHEAVYGHMLPQPMLRFLLADEPGTGKTIMAGLYATEASRLGTIDRYLIVCPAHLVGKWQDDFKRFFGRELRRITADTLREHALEDSSHPSWIVSLHLAAANPKVRDAIDPDVAGWDLVVIDEAHRLTPHAQTFFQVGLTTAVKSPRALLMTATPHRGSEWLFRSLMHLTDPDVFPLPGEGEGAGRRLKPGSVHFLRRMKEELVDTDGVTPLFKKRTAHNIAVPLNLPEKVVYDEALRLVDEYFPKSAIGLGRMVYGKRAASSLYALKATLGRRIGRMGTPIHPRETVDVDEEDRDEKELLEITHADSRSAREEKKELRELIRRIDEYLIDPQLPVSKWPKVVSRILEPNDLQPDSDEQLVVFTEYADTAEWLTERFRAEGFTAEMYSGRQSHEEREGVRGAFAAGEFQIIVSTDAGNEGIDLQNARVLVNWDIPWSLVTLEQRLGRIHRVGQDRDVDLYNMIATDTREGDAHEVLLNNLIAAANELGGKMFDSLALVGEMAIEAELGVSDIGDYLRRSFETDANPDATKAAIAAITKDRLRQMHRQLQAYDEVLASKVDVGKSIAGINEQHLDRVNPDIVERYLSRLNDCELIGLTHAALADKGLFYLTPDRIEPHELPFASAQATLIATSGQAKIDAIKTSGAAAERAVPLGPNEKAFQSLAGASATALEGPLRRGAHLHDRTSITNYRLFAFTAEVKRGRIATTPGKWRHSSRWSYLVKADDIGTRVVPWETLANLVAPSQPEPQSQHPADVHNSEAQARHEADKDARTQRQSLEGWLLHAGTQLSKLTNDLTDDIEDPTERKEARASVAAAVASRREALENSIHFELGDIELVGWAHVSGTADEEQTEDWDSELVAMKHVTRLLTDQDWKVADVHNEKLGYDLKATKGSKFRAVEVKGVKGKASSSGITVTGAELATAGMHGSDYYLYVIDECADGRGRLYAAWSDPATIFAGAAKDVPVLRINGSDLKAARERSA